MSYVTKIREAEKEGSATIFGVVEIPEISPWIRAFEEKYPNLSIKYVREYVYGIPAPMAKRIMEEKSQGKPTADGVIVALYTILEMKRLGVIQPYITKASSNYPSEFRDPQAYWNPVMLLPTIQAYNSEVVKKKDAPKSIRDLLNSVWKGKIAMHDPTLGTATTYWLIALRRWIGEANWGNFLGGLAKLDPKFYRLFPDLARDLAEGESAIGLTVHLLDYLAAKEDGQSLEILKIKEIPMLTSILGICMVSGGNHHHVAELFADFLMSEGGQRMIGNTIARIPAMLKVDARFSMKRILPNAELHVFPNEEEHLSIYLSSIRKTFAAAKANQ